MSRFGYLRPPLPADGSLQAQADTRTVSARWCWWCRSPTGRAHRQDVVSGSSLAATRAVRLRTAAGSHVDLDDWRGSWHVDPADISVGRQIVEVLTPFLLHLLDQGLAKATMRRHRDNFWTLGGELIRCRYDAEELAGKDFKDALQNLVEGDSGPLIWPRITEPEQDALDATCRKLNRFWRESAAGKRSA